MHRYSASGGRSRGVHTQHMLCPAGAQHMRSTAQHSTAQHSTAHLQHVWQRKVGAQLLLLQRILGLLEPLSPVAHVPLAGGGRWVGRRAAGERKGTHVALQRHMEVARARCRCAACGCHATTCCHPCLLACCSSPVKPCSAAKSLMSCSRCRQILLWKHERHRQRADSFIQPGVCACRSFADRAL